MATPFTMLANLCWNPSISVPAGLTRDGLPVGLQITVPRHRDDLALRLARIFEQTQPLANGHAPLDAGERQTLLLAEEALDLFGDGLGASGRCRGRRRGAPRGWPRRWPSPRRRRPAR